MHTPLALFLVCLFLATPASADIDAVTSDGRRVKLLDDQTWMFVDEPIEQSAAQLRLELVSMENERIHCAVGLRFYNNADYKVLSFVPRFAAFLASGVRYDTVFVGFQDVLPTQFVYQRLVYERIACEKIDEIQVLGGDRCNMDDLDRYSPPDGACLSRVEVVPSDLVKFYK